MSRGEEGIGGSGGWGGDKGNTYYNALMDMCGNIIMKSINICYEKMLKIKPPNKAF